MDANMNSGVLAFILERMFRYGGLWIHYEDLEGVRGVMVAGGQDTTAIDQRMAQAQALMTQIHREVQVRLAGHHLLLDYCEPAMTITAIDDGLD